jgi:hypothetical protein
MEEKPRSPYDDKKIVGEILRRYVDLLRNQYGDDLQKGFDTGEMLTRTVVPYIKVSKLTKSGASISEIEYITLEDALLREGLLVRTIKRKNGATMDV